MARRRARTVVARDVTAVNSNLMLSHETSAETPVSALQKWLLFSRQSLASERFVRGDEEADESCERTRHVARGEMNSAMIGFRMSARMHWMKSHAVRSCYLCCT
jgi:hypothetical protein